MQEKWSKVKNFPSEERKQSKNHCSPVKLESKTNDKKNNRPGEVPGWESSSDRRGKATTRLVSSRAPIFTMRG